MADQTEPEVGFVRWHRNGLAQGLAEVRPDTRTHAREELRRELMGRWMEKPGGGWWYLILEVQGPALLRVRVDNEGTEVCGGLLCNMGGWVDGLPIDEAKAAAVAAIVDAMLPGQNKEQADATK